MSVRVNLRLPDGLWELVVVRAGELGQTRTKFVERALEAALSGSPSAAGPAERESPEVDGSGSGVRAPSSPASPRAHEPDPPPAEYVLPKIAKRKW